MASNLTVMGNREILLVAETIAHEKGILVADIVHAMEEGIKSAARKKYGNNLNISCLIDKKTGLIKLFNQLKVVSDEFSRRTPQDEGEDNFDSRTHITIGDAKQKDSQAKLGGLISQELPPIDLNRVVAQVAKNEIIRKVKEAEKIKNMKNLKIVLVIL